MEKIKLNCYFTNTTIDLFNLPPNITEEQIMQSFTCQTKPVSIEINNIGQQQCWSARLMFNNKSTDDVQKALEFIDDKKFKSFGVIIPFGFICNKSNNYRLVAERFMNENTIQIKNTEDVTIDQILHLLEKNNLNDVQFVYRYWPGGKPKKTIHKNELNNNDDNNTENEVDDDFDENDINDQYEENPPNNVDEADDYENDVNAENEEKMDQNDDVISKKNFIIVSFKETKKNLIKLLNGQKINEKQLEVIGLKKYVRGISIPKKYE